MPKISFYSIQTSSASESDRAYRCTYSPSPTANAGEERPSPSKENGQAAGQGNGRLSSDFGLIVLPRALRSGQILINIHTLTDRISWLLRDILYIYYITAYCYTSLFLGKILLFFFGR
jgi:hypothetical protein